MAVLAEVFCGIFEFLFALEDTIEFDDSAEKVNGIGLISVRH